LITKLGKATRNMREPVLRPDRGRRPRGTVTSVPGTHGVNRSTLTPSRRATKKRRGSRKGDAQRKTSLLKSQKPAQHVVASNRRSKVGKKIRTNLAWKGVSLLKGQDQVEVESERSELSHGRGEGGAGSPMKRKKNRPWSHNGSREGGGMLH